MNKRTNEDKKYTYYEMLFPRISKEERKMQARTYRNEYIIQAIQDVIHFIFKASLYSLYFIAYYYILKTIFF